MIANLKNFIVETPLPVAAVSVLAVVTSVLFPQAGIPLASITAGAFTTRLVVKGLDHYNEIIATKFKVKLSKLPKIELIGIIAALILGTFNIFAGIGIGFAAGLYFGARATVYNLENNAWNTHDPSNPVHDA